MKVEEEAGNMVKLTFGTTKRVNLCLAEGMEYFKIHRRGKNESLVNSMLVCYLIGHPVMVHY